MKHWYLEMLQELKHKTQDMLCSKKDIQIYDDK
jgi:hypothetical protein